MEAKQTKRDSKKIILFNKFKINFSLSNFLLNSSQKDTKLGRQRKSNNYRKAKKCFW